MKSLEENVGEISSLACSNGWGLLPFVYEFGKSDRSLLKRDGQSAITNLLSSHEVTMAFCSPDRLLKNHDFELALPVGEVYDGPCGLAYLTIENCDDFKNRLAPRVQALKELFSHGPVSRSDDMRAAASYIWDASKSLAEPRLKEVPFLNLGNKCSTYATLARILYKLLFGSSAYETNEMMQGSSRSFHQGKCVELRQGNEALSRRAHYSAVIDLIELWNEITGLPFVASVIQKSGRISIPGAKQNIVSSADLAQARMKVEPSTYLPDIAPLNCHGQRIDLSGIWKHLNYRLASEDFKSLMLYLNLAKPLIKKPLDDDSFKIKMIRWQERKSHQTQI